MDKAAVLDVYRTVAVGNIHGVEVMPAVYWHTSPKHTDKMLHVLSPFLEQIGQLVVHLASCVSSAASNYKVYCTFVYGFFSILK